jgi:tetratricopeptide (TPR) repeat protein
LKKYKTVRKRTHPAEAHYNVGRAYHQMAYLHMAERHYRKVLALYTRHLMYCGTTGAVAERRKYAKLAAGNLIKMYRKIGDEESASEVMDQYQAVLG